MNNKEHLMVAIDHEKPLHGQRLDDVLAWERPLMGAGCYCEPASRKHKWGIVLETIHYALAQEQKRRSKARTGEAVAPEERVREADAPKANALKANTPKAEVP
jgi:hypothetical protein